MLTHSTPRFSGDYYISALRGVGPSNLYTPYNPLNCISRRTGASGGLKLCSALYF